MEYVELKLFRLEYVSVSSFLRSSELVSAALIAQQGSIVHRLINSQSLFSKFRKFLISTPNCKVLRLPPTLRKKS